MNHYISEYTDYSLTYDKDIGFVRVPYHTCNKWYIYLMYLTIRIISVLVLFF